MFLKSVKNSMHAVLYNPSIVLFMVLFLILVNIILAFAVAVNLKITATILTLCAFLLLLVFLAGWFNVIKNSLYEEKIIEKIRQNKYFPIFTEGVGKNILVIALGVILYLLITFIAFTITAYVNLKLYGDLSFVFKDIQNIPMTNEALYSYVANLPTDKLYKIYASQLSFMLVSFTGNYLMLFYFPSLVDEKNINKFLKPLWAIKNSIVLVFKKFLKTFPVYVLANIVYLILFYLYAQTQNYALISAIIFFLNIYFVAFLVVLIFNYYENYSNNRTNSLRENEISNQLSQND